MPIKNSNKQESNKDFESTAKTQFGQNPGLQSLIVVGFGLQLALDINCIDWFSSALIIL
jgi:hypothetical protein